MKDVWEPSLFLRGDMLGSDKFIYLYDYSPE